MFAPSPKISKLSRSRLEPCQRRGYQTKGTMTIRPSTRSTLKESSLRSKRLRSCFLNINAQRTHTISPSSASRDAQRIQRNLSDGPSVHRLSRQRHRNSGTLRILDCRVAGVWSRRYRKGVSSTSLGSTSRPSDSSQRRTFQFARTLQAGEVDCR